MNPGAFEKKTKNQFIRYFHQSPIPNLRIFLTNIYHDFFNWHPMKQNCPLCHAPINE